MMQLDTCCNLVHYAPYRITATYHPDWLNTKRMTQTCAHKQVSACKLFCAAPLTGTEVPINIRPVFDWRPALFALGSHAICTRTTITQGRKKRKIAALTKGADVQLD